MKTVILMVLFSTVANPEPHEGSRYGYGHREAPDMESCIKRRDFLTETLSKQAGEGDYFTAFCIEMEVHGYSEAIDDFRRSIGNLL